ncbi:MAG: hypothetical protein ABUT20_43700, partial [Bacteroidota bacterium]
MKKIFTLAMLIAVLMFGNYNATAQCNGPTSRTAPLVGLQYNAVTRTLVVAFGIVNNSASTSNVQIVAFTGAFRYDTSIMKLQRQYGGGYNYAQSFGPCVPNAAGTSIVSGSYTYNQTIYSQYNTTNWMDVIDQRSSNACSDMVPVNDATGAKTFFKYWFTMSERGHQMIMNNQMKVDPASSCDSKFILRIVNTMNYAIPVADSASLKIQVFAMGNNATYKGVKLHELDASGSQCNGTVGSTQAIPTGNTSFDVGGLVVPVKFSNFNVTKHSKSAYITWTTESENSNLGFTIER